MKAYFAKPPYAERFSNIWLWSEWTGPRPGFDAADIGTDLVAEERGDGVRAIRCKCHAPGVRIAKPDLDSFIAASARDPFTARIVAALPEPPADDEFDLVCSTSAFRAEAHRRSLVVARGARAREDREFIDVISEESRFGHMRVG